MGSWQHLTVLLVDDMAFVRGVVVRMAKRIGFGRVVEVGTAADARVELNGPPDRFCLVLLDLHMPEESGLALLKQIRMGDTAAPRDIPCCIISGYAEPVMIHRAQDLDANGFLVKPVSQATLADRLASICRQPRTIRPPSSYSDVCVEAEFRPFGPLS